jgi:protein-L-isoaspartate(D-aspartate) O-methyltransferase
VDEARTDGDDPSWADARNRMVDAQLARRDIHDPRVLATFRAVPRHRFVPERARQHAYDDRPQSIGASQTISQPYMVALMTQELQITGTERVLEIGTGSGYQTAVLAELAPLVYTVERIETLALRARVLLDEMEYRNIRYRVGDGTLGWPEEGPFDRIVVTAGAPEVPDALKGQLADGGILVIPVGGEWLQTLVQVTRKGKSFQTRRVTDCVFVKLRGEQGWAVKG